MVFDPNTNLPIEKGQEVFGHKTGKEWGKYKKETSNQNKTRKEVIEDQNNPNIYQIEDKKSNASHKYEEKWNK
ncbi:MAG: type IV secretion protein Rhs [Mediterranea massiliensis]|nr:type IV secretion protein Rhs [Mediterranea massiliensis]